MLKMRKVAALETAPGPMTWSENERERTLDIIYSFNDGEGGYSYMMLNFGQTRKHIEINIFQMPFLIVESSFRISMSSSVNL
jgi:hypothetical protein